ncbi:MAG: hypothetical protein FWC17_06345 [Treponema sp.]|nr:hypothetical protein [Treponema sp.]
MKNSLKLLGIIAFIAIIGFSMASCGEEDDVIVETNSFANTSWSGPGMSLSFTSSNFTLIEDGEIFQGTYTYSGNTATLTGNGFSQTATISGNTLSMGGVTFTRN